MKLTAQGRWYGVRCSQDPSTIKVIWRPLCRASAEERTFCTLSLISCYMDIRRREARNLFRMHCTLKSKSKNNTTPSTQEVYNFWSHKCMKYLFGYSSLHTYNNQVQPTSLHLHSTSITGRCLKSAWRYTCQNAQKTFSITIVKNMPSYTLPCIQDHYYTAPNRLIDTNFACWQQYWRKLGT